MIPSLKKIGAGIDSVFETLIVNDSYFYPFWHYHPQYEIMLIEKSTGTRYVGDNIGPFNNGDITFLGSNIPHLFRNSPDYFNQKSKKKAKATVLYISETFVDSDFFDIDELLKIKEVFRLSQHGLRFYGPSKSEVARRLNRTVRSSGPDRVINFLSLLRFIAQKAEYETLASLGFTYTLDQKETSRLNLVFQYLMENFQNNPTLSEVARVANMSETAFCRYFKKHTNKTMITFLNEIRIGHACKLLIVEKTMNVSQIGFECGFNNLTNFGLQFKKHKGMSPLNFRRKHQGMYVPK